MALTAALKAQIAAWYKALQEQIPDFIPRPPQRQMIADVAKTLAGEEGRHLAIEAPTGVGKTPCRIKSTVKTCRCCVKSFPTCALPPPLAVGATSVRVT